MSAGINITCLACGTHGRAVRTQWLTAAYGFVPALDVHRRLPAVKHSTVRYPWFMPWQLGDVGGNMLFLYISATMSKMALDIGDYLAFYFAVRSSRSGHSNVRKSPSSTVPWWAHAGADSLGFSVATWFFILERRYCTEIPYFYCGFRVWAGCWFFQLWLVVGSGFLTECSFMGTGSLGLGSQGGIAFFAHIEAFLTGLLLVKPMRQIPRTPNGVPGRDGVRRGLRVLADLCGGSPQVRFWRLAGLSAAAQGLGR